ncbi:MAG TPA: hypothetical protein VGA51_02010 [Casimicrobiaceae bacterium]
MISPAWVGVKHRVRETAARLCARIGVAATAGDERPLRGDDARRMKRERACEHESKTIHERLLHRWLVRFHARATRVTFGARSALE